MPSKKFYSHGKLLLTGEYVVLDSALALTLPTKFGQSLEVVESENQGIYWESFTNTGEKWFKTGYLLVDNKVVKQEQISSEHTKTNEVLLNILNHANNLNPKILSENKGFKIIAQLEFPNNWGLGSSSTLINNIAQWFEIDAYKLLKCTFGGSGFDIAAAQNQHPVTYQLNKGNRLILNANFDPAFKDELFFVHSNRKQNSRESIKHYKAQPKEMLENNIQKISAITSRMLSCESLEEFELLLEIHETLISKMVKLQKIKSELFPDYPGAVKSLGGWGGDFFLATGKGAQAYFREKGYPTILSYRKMVL